MSPADGTCEYVLDPDDPETWGGEIDEECWLVESLLDEDGVWACPHDAKDNKDLCIFHLPVTKKNDEEVVDAFLNALEEAAISGDTATRRSEFIGAKFGDFDLSENPLDQTVEGGKLAMNYAEISGILDWADSIIDVSSIHFNGIKCSNNANFGNVIFNANAVFYDAEFSGKVGFHSTEFKGVAGFKHAEFAEKIVFDSTSFWGEVTFEKATLGDSASFDDVLFGGEVTFENATFEDYVSFNNAAFGEHISFDNAIFKGIPKFENALFDCDTVFTHTEFRASTTFENATFKNDTTFEHANFDEGVIFSEASFRGPTIFIHAEFRDNVIFRNAEFEGETSFGNVVFEGNPSFKKTVFDCDTTFIYTSFSNGAVFAETEFDGDTSFESTEFGASTLLIETLFKGDATFDNAVFEDDTTLEDVEFVKEISFSNSEFKGNTVFKNIDISSSNFEGASLIGVELIETNAEKTNFREAHLENADFDGVDLSGANLERAKLSNSDLFGADLSGAHLYAARIGDGAINTETVFDNKHGEYRCVYDPNSEYQYDPADDEQVGQFGKAMGAYHVLEQLTRANTLPDKQAKFFARRQDMRRAQLREDGRRLNYWFAEAQNVIFRHGESFSRVVGWSLGTIVVFAFIFPLGGWLQSDSTGSLTYGAIAESPELMWQAFYHSLLLFLTGGGPLSPTGFVGEVLTAVESLIAPILLALLIFVLGRRAAR